MTWRQRCEEIANQLPGGFEADTQMLEFLQVAINELQQQIQHEEIAEFIAREGIGNRQIQAGGGRIWVGVLGREQGRILMMDNKVEERVDQLIRQRELSDI